MANKFFGTTTHTIHAKNLKRLRKIRRENQTEFWCRFGVSQSCGSRFEKGMGIPPSVAILIALYLERKVSDADLLAALRNSRPADGLE